MRPDRIIACEGALIVGAGIAGLFTALKLSPYPTTVIAGTRPGSSGSSAWAQGGIAAALGERDNWQAHATDTIKAGAGISDPAVVDMVTREARARIDDLIAFGAAFDRASDGSLALGREAAHSAARIVHVSGDRAGAEISSILAARALSTASVSVREGFQALELATEGGRIAGVFARPMEGQTAEVILFRSPAVILATGGLGALYAVTTNPRDSCGEGLGMAARAGALVADAEFVQFHPTALAVGRDPAPLATEALRGEGAALIDGAGRRFMPAFHPDAELAPRDIVARAVHREIIQGRRVYLDCREAVGTKFAQRFPTVFAACKSAGIDPATDPIPVSPAAHYHMGGIATDANGRSSLDGLWAVGECASTGLHGANRLASNSLLEALVLGARTAEDVRNRQTDPSARATPPAPLYFAPKSSPRSLRELMTRYVGLERDEGGLERALEAIVRTERAGHGDPALLNRMAAAKLVTTAALVRQESRGAHFRTDYPTTMQDGERSFFDLTEAGRLSGELSAQQERTVAP